MINFTLKQLKYFNALAKVKNFQKAAIECNISQPALSMQIKELEKQIDEKLFEKVNGGFFLTKLGESLVEKSSEILNLIENLTDDIRSKKINLKTITIGAIPTVAPYFLPTAIKLINKKFKNTEVKPRESITSKLINDILNNKLDLAIVALPILNNQIEEYKLFEEEFVLIRNKNELNKPVPNNHDLTKMKLLLLEEGHCFRDQALSFCNNSVSTKNLMEGTSLSTLVQMVGVGIGVTLIPQMSVKNEVNNNDVVIQKFNDPKPKRTIGLVWRKNNPLKNIFKEFAKTFKLIKTN